MRLYASPCWILDFIVIALSLIRRRFWQKHYRQNFYYFSVFINLILVEFTRLLCRPVLSVNYMIIWLNICVIIHGFIQVAGDCLQYILYSGWILSAAKWYASFSISLPDLRALPPRMTVDIVTPTLEDEGFNGTVLRDLHERKQQLVGQLQSQPLLLRFKTHVVC